MMSAHRQLHQGNRIHFFRVWEVKRLMGLKSASFGVIDLYNSLEWQSVVASVRQRLIST